MARILTRTGLSLVETILSLFLLSAVVLLVFNLFPSSLACISRSDQNVRGDEVAQSVLDEQACAPFKAVTAPYSADLPNQVWGGITYSPHLDVFLVPSQNSDLIKGLRVTVSWVVSGQTHQSVHEQWLANVTR